MSLRMFDNGAMRILNTFFDARALTVKLYSAPTATLTDALTAGSFTEVAGGGYASKAIAAGDNAVSLLSGIPTADFPELVWTFTGPLTGSAAIAGYVVIDNTSGEALWAEHLATAFTPQNNNDKLSITPRFMLGNTDDAAAIAL